jgi:hypothetical protein
MNLRLNGLIGEIPFILMKDLEIARPTLSVAAQVVASQPVELLW